MDGIKEMLDRLSELDEGQLSDLESKIIDEFTRSRSKSQRLR